MNTMKKRRSQEFKKNSDIIDIEEARAARKARREKYLKDEEAREKEKEKRRPSVRLRKKQRRTRILLAVLVFLVCVMLAFSVSRIIKVKHEKNVALEEQQQLKDEKKELKKELRNANDKETIERRAREQLRLLMPGEKLLILPESK